MQSIVFSRVATLSFAIALISIFGAANAQDHNCNLQAVSGTKTADANFACVMAKLEALGRENQALQKRVHELETVPGGNADLLGVPSDAVLAFDRPGRCPKGWAEFAEAQSRVIIGATFGIPDTIDPDAKLAQSKYRDHGGEQTVTLTLEEMPKHAHGAGSLKTGDTQDFLHSSGQSDAFETTRLNRTHGLFKSPPHHANSGEHSHRVDGTTAPSGAGASHNNMPPYIALYYCKKS